YEQQSYMASESYACGTSMCSRPVTRYHSVPRTRMVTKVISVTDGHCAGTVSVAPESGGVYLLQYTYQPHAAGSLSCFAQGPVAGGRFEEGRWPVPAVAAK